MLFALKSLALQKQEDIYGAFLPQHKHKVLPLLSSNTESKLQDTTPLFQTVALKLTAFSSPSIILE